MSGSELTSVWHFFAILFLVFDPCACEYCDEYTDSSGVFNRGFYCPRLYDWYSETYCCGSTSTGKYCCDWEKYQEFKSQDDEGISTLAKVVIGVIIFIGVISFCIIFVCVCVVTASNSNSSTNGSRVHVRRTRVTPIPDNEMLAPPPYPAMGRPPLSPPAYDDIYQHSENHNRPPVYTVSGQESSMPTRPVHPVDTTTTK